MKQFVESIHFIRVKKFSPCQISSQSQNVICVEKYRPDRKMSIESESVFESLEIFTCVSTTWVSYKPKYSQVLNIIVINFSNNT